MSAISLDHRLTAAFYTDKGKELTEAAHPLIPLTAEGMPLPGANFIAHAVALGDMIDVSTTKKKKAVPASENLIHLYRAALYSPTFVMPVLCKTGLQPLTSVPGHVWGFPQTTGPRAHARVMVVGKLPGIYEVERGNFTAGPAMKELAKTLQKSGIPPTEFGHWYVTAACKFAAYADGITIPAAWFRDCALLLEQEIRMVAPDYILCLGAEATKAVMQTSGNTANMAGRVLVLPSRDKHGAKREIKVMSVMHPAYVARKPDAGDDYVGQLTRFKLLLNDQIFLDDVVDHAEIYTEAALVEMVDAMIADTNLNANIIAVDCEWHGEHPTEPGAYLRTVQVSNRDKWARTIVLRHQGGTVAFQPGLEVVQRELLRLLKSTPARHVRPGGHFLRADLPWLLAFGVNIMDEYAPSLDQHDRTHGGWDTSLMYHATNECARYGLDACSMRFTSAPTYWEKLDKWKKKHCADNKLKVGDLGGYGEVPDRVLMPYAGYDVDVTRRIMMCLYGTDGTDGLLAKDVHEHDCWLPYWVAHSASLAFLEMELTGFVIDRQRADELTTLFMNTQDKLLAEIQAELCWPNFNPKSQPQLAVALFGAGFGARYTNAPTIPEGAQLLNLRPIKTTGKRPTLWKELGQRHIDETTATPSTDKESLGILGHSSHTAAKIRDYKFTSQVLQSVLRKPSANDAGEFDLDEQGNFEYEKGLVGCVHADGRVRTHLFQTKETGRASSSRPPLQNLSSRREDDYRRILGSQYQHPVRSVLRVPEGCVGIETDLTGAELAVLAWLAQDQGMIDHVRRNSLPENHPDHYDIHSQQAVKTFNLTGIEPTKAGLKAAGKKGLRVAAKNVNFGIPYGRGSEAISRQCKEEGEDVTPNDCQLMIDAYFSSYPKTKDFLRECRERSQVEGWLVGPYGRYRRFVNAHKNDTAVRGEQERQAQNFPIQGGVADAVSIALSNFWQYRKTHTDIEFKIGLQIHDAVILIVPIAHAERVYKEVIPQCMVDDVPFWPRRLDGSPIAGAGPYKFGMSRDVFVHWGESLSAEDIKTYGLSWLNEE